jgi:hypothetical protein
MKRASARASVRRPTRSRIAINVRYARSVTPIPTSSHPSIDTGQIMDEPIGLGAAAARALQEHVGRGLKRPQIGR